jgi:hypothetical protein
MLPGTERFRQHAQHAQAWPTILWVVVRKGRPELASLQPSVVTASQLAAARLENERRSARAA